MNRPASDGDVCDLYIQARMVTMTLGSQGVPVCGATDDVTEWKEEGGVIKWSCWCLVIY